VNPKKKTKRGREKGADRKRKGKVRTRGRQPDHTKVRPASALPREGGCEGRDGRKEENQERGKKSRSALLGAQDEAQASVKVKKGNAQSAVEGKVLI